MQDILKQLQEAIENFDNLFEVDGDGLGNPAEDVPPSTNKIKKDIKTKNGKVELVSVEDELFPKEGNAKEQFKQKVLDKINAMIQGTGTLEDLLNVVRAKQVKPVKEGFEGAIEILESLLTTIRTSTNIPKEKKQKLISKLGKARAEEEKLANEKAFNSWVKGEGKQPTVETKRGAEYTKNASGERKTKLRSPQNNYTKAGFSKVKPEWKQVEDSIKRHDEKKAKLGEALELLEDLYTKIKKEHGEPEYAGIDSHPANKSAELIHKMSDAKGKEYAEEKEKNPDINLYNKRCTTKNTRGEQKTQNRSSKYRKFSDDWRLPKTDDEKVEGSIRRNQEKKAKLGEALELLEEIINEVSVGKLAQAAENSFSKRQEEHKKSTEGLKKAHDSYEEQSKKHPEDEQALYNSLDKLSRITHKAGEKAYHANEIVNLNLPKDSKVSANKLFDKADKTYDKRGKAVDKALEKGKGRGDREFDAPMKKFSRAVDLAVADPVVARRTNGGTNESFDSSEEKSYNENKVLKLLEAIINEVSNKKIKIAVSNKDELIDGARKLKDLIRTDKDKKLIEDAIVRDQHRVEVARDKLENRIVDKARAENESKKGKKKERD